MFLEICWGIILHKDDDNKNIQMAGFQVDPSKQGNSE